MTSATFYADARKRLIAVTDDAAVLAALDRMAESAGGDDRETDAALGVFLREAARLNLSLDYIFCGAGEPHMRWERA